MQVGSRPPAKGTEIVAAITVLALSLPEADRLSLAERLVGRPLNTTPPEPVRPALICEREAGRRWGCSWMSIRRLRIAGLLPYAKMGSRILIDPLDMEALLARLKRGGTLKARGRPTVTARATMQTR